MISEFIKALFFIFAAEMGDKTQILAMTLATRFKLKDVVIGIFIGSLLNHGLAVALGAALGTFIPISILQLIGGVAFLIFGLWSLKLDDDEEEDVKIKFHPIYTVALTFFIGELGDKTQLTAISLAMSSGMPIVILMGTVSGMMLTSAIGIFLGIKIGNKLSENYIKIFSFCVFSVFGALKLMSQESVSLTGVQGILVIGFIWVLTTFYLGRKRYMAATEGRQLAVDKAMNTLHQKMQVIAELNEGLCLGRGVCGSCIGERCLVGFIRGQLQGKIVSDFNVDDAINTLIVKDIDTNKVIKNYIEVMNILQEHYKNPKVDNVNFESINRVRKALEKIVFGKIVEFKTWEQYCREISMLDVHISNLLKNIGK